MPPSCAIDGKLDGIGRTGWIFSTRPICVDRGHGDNWVRRNMMTRRIGGSLWVLCLWLACQALVAHGQGFQSRYSPTDGMLLPAPREIEFLLEEARDAIKRSQWSEATLALGVLLGIDDGPNSNESGEDYFLFADNDRLVTQGSVMQSAHGLLASLPEEGQRVVELRYGVRAAQLLEEAIERLDWNQIQDIASRYGFTIAGQDATLIVAERAFGDGRPRQAAARLERLMRLDQARERLGPQLGILAIAAYQAAGMSNQAREVLANTRQEFPTTTLEWRGAKIGWNDRTSNEAILQSLSKEPAVEVPRLVKRPAYPGGNAMRNANTPAGLPLPILRWHVELHESLQHKDNLDRVMKKQLAERKSVLIPTRYPISVDSWIMTPTYDQRILAIDTKTGRIGWPCVFSGMPLGFSLDRFASRDGFSLGLPAPDYLVRRVWGDTAVGQIASDGERLFSLSELPAIDVAESFAQGPNARLVRNLGMKSFNVLQAWSIKDQGKLLWECGGPTGGTSSELAGALFLGSPLPRDGELLSLVELNGEIFLVALSGVDGSLKWRQPIAANQGTTISLDPQRRSYGASPAVDGSIVVCPTLSGYMVAYDMAARELLWQFRYPLNPNLNPAASFNFIGGMDARESNPTIPRSVETSVLLHQGVAVFAPPNGNAVYGVSMTDGTELWQIGYDEPSLLRYVGGIWDNTAIIVQSTSVLGVDLRTGEAKWPAIPFPNGGQVVGRSARHGSKVYIPTSNNDILQIDVEKGAIDGAVQVEKPLGNLIVVEDRLVSASPFQLDCYSIRDVFQQRMLDELQRDGQTVRSLIQQGELAIAAGDIDVALDALEKAQASAPEDPDVRLLLVKVGTMALRKDFDLYVDRVQRYQELTLDLDLPSYLRMLIHGLEKQERWEEVMVKLLELSDTRLNRRIDQMSDGQDIDMNPQWVVQEDRWIATRVARCAEKIGPEGWTRLAPLLASRVDPEQNKDRGALRLRLEHLQSLRQSDPLRLVSAAWFLRSSPIEAERVLQFRIQQDDTLPPKRKEMLAEVYLRADRSFTALRSVDGDVPKVLEILQRIKADARPYPARNEVDPRQVARFAELASSMKQRHEWPTGSVEVTEDFMQNNGLPQFDVMSDASSLCPVAESIGDALENWQVYYNASGFQFINNVTGEQFQQLVDAGSLDRSTVPNIYTIDSLVLIELKNQLVAIDTLQAYNSQQDGKLWRNAFGDDTAEIERGRGRNNVIERNVWGLPIQRRSFRVAAVSRSGVVILNNDDLSCLDLYTGNRVWSVSGFRNANFVRKENQLIAYQPMTGNAVHLDLRDGMILKTVDAQQKGWLPMVTVGNRWLFSPERSPSGDRESEMKLRLVEPDTCEVLLSRDFSPDTRLTVVGDSGVAALKADGELVYWNIGLATENVYNVDVEGKFSLISAQVFGDTALILPYAGSMELEKILVSPSPRSDPSVAACAGRMFAISVEDGRPVWARSQRVKHYMFPLSQSRVSPAAIFVRRLSLTKVRGQNLDFTSIAIVDVKTGRLLYQRDDLPAIRGEAFRQKLLPAENSMVINYLGNMLTAHWTNEEAGLAPLDLMQEIGELDPDDFRGRIEARLDSEVQQETPQPSKPRIVPEDREIK